MKETVYRSLAKTNEDISFCSDLLILEPREILHRGSGNVGTRCDRSIFKFLGMISCPIRSHAGYSIGCPS
jgi:hypothetical protein